MELEEAIKILKRVILVNNFESYSSEGIIIEAIETVLNHLTGQEKTIMLYKNTGKLVKNKIDGTIGIVLREWETGQVQVLEKIQPKIINTHDNWKTLELIEESE